MCLWKRPSPGNFMDCPDVDERRSMQLPHYVKVPSQTIEALKTEHRVRILHGHRVFDQKNRPAIDKIDYLSMSGTQ